MDCTALGHKISGHNIHGQMVIRQKVHGQMNPWTNDPRTNGQHFVYAFFIHTYIFFPVRAILLFPCDCSIKNCITWS